MGMFDNVIVEVPLPDGGSNEYIFQTKDLDCELHNYIITKDRKLVRDGEETDFHGWLYFYDGSTAYEAKFTDGALVEIVVYNDNQEGE